MAKNTIFLRGGSFVKIRNVTLCRLMLYSTHWFSLSITVFFSDEKSGYKNLIKKEPTPLSIVTRLLSHLLKRLYHARNRLTRHTCSACSIPYGYKTL